MCWHHKDGGRTKVVKTGAISAQIKEVTQACMSIHAFFNTTYLRWKKMQISTKKVLEEAVNTFLLDLNPSTYLLNFLCNDVRNTREEFWLYNIVQQLFYSKPTWKFVYLCHWIKSKLIFSWNTIVIWKDIWHTNYGYWD